MSKKGGKGILLAVMFFAFAAAAGTLINGVFALVGSAGRDSEAVRMFIVSICFFVAGLILKRVLARLP